MAAAAVQPMEAGAEQQPGRAQPEQGSADAGAWTAEHTEFRAGAERRLQQAKWRWRRRLQRTTVQWRRLKVFRRRWRRRQQAQQERLKY